MTDDAQKDLAIEYVLGDLAGDARHEFEIWMESDPDLQLLVEELSESAAALAHDIPAQAAPAHLRAAVLGAAGAETEASPRRPGWIPWAVAAALAIGCIILAVDRGRWHSAARTAQATVAAKDAAATALEREKSGVAGRLALAEVQAKIHTGQIAEMAGELARLRNRDTFAQMKIATLAAKTDDFSRAGAMIVWDPEEQRGIICASNLPRPAAGKEYQLWVMAPGEAAPVNAGSLSLTENGAAQVTFKPVRAVGGVEQFAISLESAGALAQETGPVVLSGTGALPKAP